MTIDRKKFVPISKLSEEFNRRSEVGRNQNTIRRYLNDYPDYFNVVMERSLMLVELEPALGVLLLISRTVASGRNRGKHEVHDALEKSEFKPVPKEPPSEVGAMQPESEAHRVMVDLTPEVKDWLQGMFDELGNKIDKSVSDKRGGAT